MVKKRKAKKTKIKRKQTAKKNKPKSREAVERAKVPPSIPPVQKRAPDEDVLPTTLDEFKKPSPHYKFETTPGGQRMLSAPNNSERSLLSFQPYAQRALAIAEEHRLRIRPHLVQGSGCKMLYDLIVFFFP